MSNSRDVINKASPDESLKADSVDSAEIHYLKNDLSGNSDNKSIDGAKSMRRHITLSLPTSPENLGAGCPQWE